MSKEFYIILARLFSVISNKNRITCFNLYFKNKISDKELLFLQKIYQTNEDNPKELCHHINTTLNLKQKIILLIKLFELLSYDKKHTSSEIESLFSVSKLLNISPRTTEIVTHFVIEKEITFNIPEFVHITFNNTFIRRTDFDKIETDCTLLFIKEINIFLFRKFHNHTITLNKNIVNQNHIYFFSEGDQLESENGTKFIYNDLIRTISKNSEKILFEVNDLSFSYDKKSFDHQKISLKETEGKLIGIMGASGSGKTTLLNLLSGIEKPTTGKVFINGLDINEYPEKIKGVIGYIGQDDILMENLTVYENLFYNAQLCYKNKTVKQLDKLVFETLHSLDLSRVAGLPVGNVLNKMISGGQRKRLNIALELIREPHILFVDEPTSGLSSQDSKNVMRLLNELKLKGKLIFIVIHQPSAEIFQSFDKVLILDIDSTPIFYGTPMDSVNYFNSHDDRFKSEKRINENCEKTNPEQIFEIIESKKINIFGQETNIRKKTNKEWNRIFSNQCLIKNQQDISPNHYKKTLLSNLHLPNKFQQTLIFAKRDFSSKWSNKQYMIVNLLASPVLAFLLSILLRHKNNENNTEYVFGLNENIPAFILVSVIVSLFMGLSISAEEILKDKKIRKREHFLNLNKHSYLLSKIIVLTIFSALQTLTFTLITHHILKIENMVPIYWLMLFTTATCGNLIGLNVSNSFKHITTTYISIPLILIPQLVLSGALFDFEKLNQSISEHGKTPIISDIMASRWAYEGLAVWQDKENKYNKRLYQVDKEISSLNYYKNYWLTEVIKLKRKGFEIDTEIEKFNHRFDQKANVNEIEKIKQYLNKQMLFYKNVKNRLLTKIISKENKTINKQKEKHMNNRLHYVVKHLDAEHRILHTRDGLTQNMDAIYQEAANSNYSYRAPLYIAYKNLLGYKIHTYWFNLLVIWLFSLMLYYSLYYDLLKRLITFLKKDH